MSDNKENDNPMTSPPSDLKVLSLDFEKKLLLYQLDQEKAKNMVRAKAIESSFQQIIENLTSQLKEKENVITHLTLKSSQEQPVDPTILHATNDTAIENPPEGDKNVSDMMCKIDELEQQLLVCNKDKGKIADQLQTCKTEMRTLSGQMYQITIENQREKEKHLQSLKELEERIELQKVEIENLSKTMLEDEKKNLKKINDLQQELQSSQIEEKKCSDENKQLKWELNQTRTDLNKVKKSSQIEQNENKIKLENLTINLDSKTNQVNQLEKDISQLKKDHQNNKNGIKYKNLCTKIQELGKNMESLCDQQFEEKDKQINTLQRQMKDFKSCLICFDEMESSGDHRSVSLPCGHIFGNKCLRLCPTCPKCRIPVNSTTLRSIYLN